MPAVVSSDDERLVKLRAKVTPVLRRAQSFLESTTLGALQPRHSAHEAQQAAEKYEKMMAHFQLRKLEAIEDPGVESSTTAQFYRSRTFADEDNPPTPVSRLYADDALSSGHEGKPGVGIKSQRQVFTVVDEVKKPRPRPRRSRILTLRRLYPHLRRVKRSIRRFQRSLLSPWVPTSLAFKLRGLVLALVFAAQLVYLPLVPAYYSYHEPVISLVNRTFEALFLLDVLLKFNTSFYDKESLSLVTSRRRIAQRYIRGWLFLDLLSAVPVDLILHLGKSAQADNPRQRHIHTIFHVLLRLPRLVHIWLLLGRFVWVSRKFRVGKELFTWLLYSRYSHLVRIARMILLVVLTAHYIACGWHLVTGDDPNAPNAVPPGSSVWDQYVSDLYYAVLLIQGQGVSSGGTTSQNLFSVVAVLVGSIVLAIVFGNVAMLVANFNANSTSHQRKMEAVFATMNKLRLPQDLRDRIHQYYEYVWHEYESLDGDVVKFSKELTHTLALEVGLYRHMDLVMNVPFWRGCSPDFVKQLVLSLSVRVYLPDDYVVRAGEVGTEMYLVNCGTCEFVGAEFIEAHRSTIPASTKLTFQGNPLDETDQPMTSRTLSKLNSRMSTYRCADHDESNWQSRRLSRKSSQRSSISSISYPCGEPAPRSDRFITKGCNGTARGASADSETSPPFHEKIRNKRHRLRKGDSVGEMALLLNYRRSATIRAASYVEMCVLSRDRFQQLLSRYVDDRHTVLRGILSASIDNAELSLNWREMCERFGSTQREVMRDTINEDASKDDIVEFLLDRITHGTQDPSIVYGFQESRSHVTETYQTRERDQILQHRSSRSYPGIALEKVKEVDAMPSTRTEEGSVEESPEDAIAVITVKEIPRPHGVFAPEQAIATCEQWRSLEADVERLDSRLQSVETAQVQVIAMLQDIKTHLTFLEAHFSQSAAVADKPSVHTRSSKLGSPGGTFQDDLQSEAKPPKSASMPRLTQIHQPLNRRSSGPSSGPSATRLADELWCTQTNASRRFR